MHVASNLEALIRISIVLKNIFVQGDNGKYKIIKIFTKV